MSGASMTLDLSGHGLHVETVFRNLTVDEYYDRAVQHGGEDHYVKAASGALIAKSGEKTGRSPKDKRVVDEPETSGDIWWGSVNMKLGEEAFGQLKAEALAYLNGRPRLYVVDAFAGWDPKYRTKVRVICSRVYHALFMHNMLIRPTAEQLQDFGEPDWVIYNAGEQKHSEGIEGLPTGTTSSLNFAAKEFVIMGSEYAGEMKKGVFTILNYMLPKVDVLSMHCSANEGQDGDTALFFGLSGTGKTTLSADPKRNLIGDDEHAWSEEGIFNFEGGCYAKTIDLSEESEPSIWNAIRYGSILENVVYDEDTMEVDYSDGSLTENTRCAYPVEFIDHVKIPCVGGHPNHVIFLTCDAFGVLPPVSRLTPGQAMYHFISGYTAKVAGTEVGVTEPEATFSACFGAAFLVWHPMKYAEMLAEKMKRHGAHLWLVNTGWSGGAHGVGERISLKHTRGIIDAILGNALNDTPVHAMDVFGLQIPDDVPGVPAEILHPKETWDDKDAFDEAARKLAVMFNENFAKYADHANEEVRAGAPKV